MILREEFGSQAGIQFREDLLNQQRPQCPRRCPGPVHRHGCYWRYASPDGQEKESIQRFLCRPCGGTLSVLPAHRLPYRSIRAERLQADFDQRSGIDRRGPDPPPTVKEAGCLKRAWSSLSARVSRLTKAFGQLLPGNIEGPQHLWRELRLTKNSAASMLRHLSQHHHISLLGDYRCLRPPT